jgi:hypothetical protein
VRFWVAGLPADQALAVVPRQDALVAGAVALSVFVIIGLIAVAIAYLLDRQGAPSTPTRIGLVLLAVIGLVPVIVVADLDTQKTAVCVASVVVVGALIVFLSIAFGERLPEDGGVTDGRRRRAGGEGPLRRAATTSREALERSGIADTDRVRRGAPPPPMRITTLGQLFQLLTAVLGGLVLYRVIRERSGDEEWWVLGTYVLVVLLYFACISVARATDRGFRWYGLAVFLAVAVFGAVASTMRAADNLKIQAAAVLLKDENQPICGVFVAETSDRFYLGRLDPDRARRTGRTSYLFWVAKSDLVDWAVTPLQSKGSAVHALPALSAELVRDRHQRLTTTRTATTTGGGRKPKTATKTTKTRTAPPPGQGKASCHLLTLPGGAA